MRNLLVLPTTLTILLTLPGDSLSHGAVDSAVGAVRALEPTLTSYLGVVRASEPGYVEIRVWMHQGDRQLHGCGFYFQATDRSNFTAFGFFPDETVHQCQHNRWKLRFTAQGGVYGTMVQIGRQPVRSIELHSDGWHDTFVNILCIGWLAGFNEPRAFCLTNDFLQSCKWLTNRWNSINLRWNDMKFTRTKRASHKIVFRDLENLVKGYNRLRESEGTADMLRSVCDRIDLVRGDADTDRWTCPAEKAADQVKWGGMHVGWMGRYEKQDVNPYGCSPDSLSL